MDEVTHEPILSILSLIVETAVKLRKDGHKVVIVSSGAIGVGLRRMDVDKRPKHLPAIQVRRIQYSLHEQPNQLLYTGFVCRWSMPFNVIMGLPLQPPSTASGTDPHHSK